MGRTGDPLISFLLKDSQGDAAETCPEEPKPGTPLPCRPHVPWPTGPVQQGGAQPRRQGRNRNFPAPTLPPSPEVLRAGLGGGGRSLRSHPGKCPRPGDRGVYWAPLRPRQPPHQGLGLRAGIHRRKAGRHQLAGTLPPNLRSLVGPPWPQGPPVEDGLVQGPPPPGPSPGSAASGPPLGPTSPTPASADTGQKTSRRPTFAPALGRNKVSRVKGTSGISSQL